MAFTPVNDGDLAVAPQLQQILDALQGVSGAGQPIDLVALDSDTEVALTVRNLGAGGALQVLSTAGAELLFVDDSGVTFSGTLTFADVTATGAVAANTLSAAAGLGVASGGASITGGITSVGNLTYSGTGRRILGDFTNATRDNRVLFQTTTANSASNVGVIPSGSGTSAAFSSYSGSTAATAAVQMVLNATATAGQLRVDSPSGSYQPFEVYTNNTKQWSIDTSGSVTAHTGGLNVGTTGAAAGALKTAAAITAGTSLTATSGDITASNGNGVFSGALGSNSLNVNTSGAVSGQIKAAGAVTAGTTVTAGTGITATTGNITASSGNGVISGALSANSINVNTTGAASGELKTGAGVTAAGAITSVGGSVTGATGLVATTGGVTAVAGDITASSGNGTFSGAVSGNSINVNTTGAAAGEIKTAGAVKAGLAVYPSGQATQNIAASGPLTVTALASTTLASGTSQGFYQISDASSGESCIVHLSSGLHRVGSVYTSNFGGTTPWNIDSNAGSTWAVWWDGSNYSITNRTVASRSNLYWMRLGGF